MLFSTFYFKWSKISEKRRILRIQVNLGHIFYFILLKHTVTVRERFYRLKPTVFNQKFGKIWKKNGKFYENTNLLHFYSQNFPFFKQIFPNFKLKKST